MKKLFFVLTIILALTAVTAFAQSVKEIKVSAHKQTFDKSSKLTFKLIEVEDSRCPADVDCIWAGNAKVKISISKGKSAAKIFEINSATDPVNIVFEGYQISFNELSPNPKSTDQKPITYLLKLNLAKVSKAK